MRSGSVLTLHVEVAMEIWRPTAIQQTHSPIRNLLICVHVAVILLVTVNELKHSSTVMLLHSGWM